MASINTFVQDSKLKFRRIYDTKKVTMNDFTRNAIEKRVGCSDNKGIKCIGKNIKVCDNQYSTIKCNTLIDRFKDEFGSFVYPSGITGPFLDKFIVFIDYLDNKSITNLSLSQLQELNTANNFGFNSSQLDIVYSYFDSSNYTDNVSPVPEVFDKYYNTFASTEQEYNIGDFDIANTNETDYYYYIASEQDRTQQQVVENGLKGPIEFILGTSGDPKKTIYYYTVDDWETTRIFTDNIQLDKHKYITLKIHETDYRGGIVNLHFYSIEEGYKKSPIVSQRFIIRNFHNITAKPAGGKRISYYIEYLSNWFDIDVNTGELIAPFTRDTTIDPYKDMPFNENDKELLKVYITYLKSYNYNGPTAENRTKLALPFGGDVVSVDQAKSFTYGSASTQLLLNGLKINDFLKTDTEMGGQIGFGKWLTSGCLNRESNDDYGETPSRDVFNPPPIDRVSFRMNGGSLEVKTSNKCKIKEALYVLNIDSSKTASEYGKGNISAYKKNISHANTLSVNTFVDPSGNGSLHHDFGAYVSFPEWTSIASIATIIDEETKRIAAQNGFEIKDIIYCPERIVNVKISVTDYCEAGIYEYEKRITPRDADIDITPIWNEDFSSYTLQKGGYATYFIKRNSTFSSEAFPIATDYSEDDAYRLGAKFRIELLYNNDAQQKITINNQSWEFIPQDYNDDIAFNISPLTHETRYYERLSYMKPNTFVTADDEGPANQIRRVLSHGLRGVSFYKTTLFDGNWQGNGFYKPSDRSNYKLITPRRAGIYSLPGVDNSKDLIGWKLKALYWTGTYGNYVRDTTKEVTYTIHYTYYDVNDGISDYDPDRVYVGFASINTEAEKIISKDHYGNQTTGKYVKILNRDAGFANTDIISPANYDRTHVITLESPTTIPIPSKEDLPHIKPISMDKYHPDTKAVIATGPLGTFGGDSMLYIKIMTDEYLKNPWDHSLIKSEIHYNKDTEGKPDA
uniref:Uncharacterized protein n=1 Tax=viral metagenome TaxID=1070528 RepID=A0A6C0FG33_9ZZZZ|tara:strand:+ start:8979 stop:11876 length:2898 start_codon:yes stop_codon:yes gene_type:complete